MCQECGFITGHANTCPNNPDIYEPILTDCELCGREVDEIETTYGICEKCWTEAHTLINARVYGETARESVSINGYFVKLLTPEFINALITTAAINEMMYKEKVASEIAQSFLGDDDHDFADYLKKSVDR